ncbi:MAG: hypothetical protein ACRDHC_12360 [Actinomycetota bacterium]
MDRSSGLAETRTQSRVAGWALIVGAVCFASFWALAPTSLEAPPWLPSLAVHATSIVSLAIGLGLLARGLLRSAPPQPVATVGAFLAVIGSFAFLPLFPIGLGVIAVALVRTGYPRPAVASLAIGSIAMLVVFVAQYLSADGHLFGEGSPPFPLGLELGFQASVILVAVGLVAIGHQFRRRSE